MNLSNKTPVTASEHKFQPGHKLALIVIATAQLMVMLDLTIVNIALPSIMKELHFGRGNLAWVVDAYIITFGGFLLLGGRLGDLFGKKRIFLVGIAIFTLASLVGGFAQDQIWLILARLFQGLGAAIASPTALSLIATTFEEGPYRNKAMAVYAGMSGAGGALGLLLGGVLVDISTWRWVLFVNVPIGIFVLALAPRLLNSGLSKIGKLDVPGAILISATMALLVFGFIKAGENGWSNRDSLIAFPIAIILLAAFVFVEKISNEPLLPLAFIFNLNRLGTYLIMMLLGASMLSLLYFLTQYLQEVLLYSPIKAGVAYLPIPFFVATSGMIVSRLVKRFGVRPFLSIGPLLVALGFFVLTQINVNTHYSNIFFGLTLVGIGMGLSFVPLTLNAISRVPANQTGLASSLLNSSQQLGGSLGIAILTMISVTTIRNYLSVHTVTHPLTTASILGSGSSPIQIAQIHGDKNALLMGALFATLAFFIGLLTINSKSKQSPATIDTDLQQV